MSVAEKIGDVMGVLERFPDIMLSIYNRNHYKYLCPAYAKEI